MSRFLKNFLSLRNLAPICSSRKIRLSAVFLSFGLTIFLLVLLTKQRNPTHEVENKIAHIDLLPESDIASPAKNSSPESLVDSLPAAKENPPDVNIWCEVRDYKDLSESLQANLD